MRRESREHSLALAVRLAATFAVGSSLAIASSGGKHRVRLVLHAGLCSVQVQRAILNVGEDSSRGLEESLLHALASLGRGLNEHEAVLVGKLFRFLVGDIALRLQVTLVADQKDDSVRVGQVAGIGKPRAQVVVSGTSPIYVCR